MQKEFTRPERVERLLMCPILHQNDLPELNFLKIEGRKCVGCRQNAGTCGRPVSIHCIPFGKSTASNRFLCRRNTQPTSASALRPQSYCCGRGVLGCWPARLPDRHPKPLCLSVLCSDYPFESRCWNNDSSEHAVSGKACRNR